MSIDPSWTTLLVAGTAIAAGALVQGTVGFGLAIVAVPVFAIVIPEAVPTTLLWLALPLTAGMAFHERHELDRSGFGWIVVGRVPGTVAGAAVLSLVPLDQQGVLFGSAVILAAAGSLVAPPFHPTPRRGIAAGFVSGVMGTSSAIGGPALALLYQRAPGPRLRATLSLSFFVGIVLSLVGVGLAGRASWAHLRLAVQLAPALALGVGVSRLVRRRLDRTWLRPAILSFAAVAGAGAIVRALVF